MEGGDFFLFKKKRWILVAILLLLMSTTAMAMADPYQKYLNDDRNFPLCDGHMGVAWYVNLSSLAVKLYNPPNYIISISVLTVDAEKGYTVRGTKIYQFKYNYDTQEMYVMNDAGEWRYISHNGSWAECGVVEPAGEIAFKQEYGISFYH